MSGKKLLGVVIYNDGTTGWAMTTKPVATDVNWASGEGLFSEYDIPDLPNYDYFEDERLHQVNMDELRSSCKKTDIIVGTKGENFDAARAAYNYHPDGTPDGRRWCLPTVSLFGNLIVNNELVKVFDAVEAVEGKDGKLGTVRTAGKRGYESIWTSTEKEWYAAYFLQIELYNKELEQCIINYTNGKGGQGPDGSVHPVICFGKDTSLCQERMFCSPGMTYYSDNTCSFWLDRSKTALGLVLFSDKDDQHGWVISASPVASNISWSSDYDYREEIEGLSAGINDSCTNTDMITAKGNASYYPAAWAAKNYNAGGKKWCLPSSGLLEKVKQDGALDLWNGAFRLSVPSPAFMYSSTDRSDQIYCYYYNHLAAFPDEMTTRQKTESKGGYVYPVFEFNL